MNAAAVPRTRPTLPSRHRAFTSENLMAFAQCQYMGWLWRRQFEPSTYSQAPRSSFADLFQPNNRKNLAFVLRFAPQMFDVFRFAGKEAIHALVDAGERLIKPNTLSLDPASFNNPLEGVPLRDGSRVIIPEEILCRLAYEEHTAWYHCRRWSWLLPEELQQNMAHPAHKFYSDDLKSPEWWADMRAIFGFACALGSLSLTQPDVLQSLLEASSETMLSTSAYLVSFSSDFQDFWPVHFYKYAEGWRNVLSSTKSKQVEFNKLSCAQKVLLIERAEGVVDFLRIHGKETILLLQEYGRRMFNEAISSQFRDSFDPFNGLEIADGTSIAIERELLESLAEEHWIMLQGINSYNCEFPLREVQKIARRKRKILFNISRDAERVYGFALALAVATMPERFFTELANNAVE